jgi:hypothetical protein
MIRHLLFIKFKPSVTDDQIAEVQALFESFPGKIPGTLAVEWGVNDSPEGLNREFTHAVQVTFADDAARQTYLPHPAHEALKQVFVPLLADIIVLDYSL